MTRNVPEKLPIIGDPAGISQAIMNICINARDAMPEGGEFHIEAARQGEKVVVSFSDTGHGMEEKIQEQCFDPFFTTKDVGKGTGLGLSTALGTVEVHGGEIRVESELDRGTIFTITFPLAPSVGNGLEGASPAIQFGRGQKVLVVDDEIEICKVMEKLLGALGYNGFYVCSRKAAIDTYKSWRPDVVLLDRNMSGTDGMSCIEKIVNYDPDANIVVISGYDEHGPSGLDERDRRLIKGYLTKPVDMAALSGLLASLLTP